MRRLVSIFWVVMTLISMVFTMAINPTNLQTVYALDEVVNPNVAKSALEALRNSLKNAKTPYIEFIAKAKINYDLVDVSANLITKDSNSSYSYDTLTRTLGLDDVAKYQVEIPTSGYYYLNLDYYVPETTLSNITVDLKIDATYQFDEMKIIDLPIHFKDESKEFTKDSYHDETLPYQLRVSKWINYNLNNNTYVTDNALLFYFTSGSHEIKLLNVSSNKVVLGRLRLVAPKKVISYQEYKNKYNFGNASSIETVDAISYTEKNSSYVRLGNVRDPSILPYHHLDKKLNIIDGISWRDAGQEVVYEFNVKETGMYKIALHYQNLKNDFSVFRTIKLAKENERLEVPFKELYSYEFAPTYDSWKNLTLGNKDEDFLFYFEKDVNYQIAFKSESAPLQEALSTIQLLIDHINQFSLEVRKITGKDIDVNRTWDITKYLPETKPYLQYYRTLVLYLRQSLSQYSPKKASSASLSNLSRTLSKLDKILEKPGELPLYLDQLFSGVGSVSQLLGDEKTILLDQQLSLDCFYIYNNRKLPNANSSFWDKLKNGIEVFIASFTSKKYVTQKDNEALNVWVNRPITYVDTMQKLVDSTFTKETGIKVKMSVMPDANKLILATAAQSGPDIALGLPSFMPFDLAIRGAVVPLTSFDDFWLEAEKFAPGALIPYVLNDDVYALPETLDFNATFYRTDIFDNLGLTPPDTWDDVLKMVYTLQRFGMNFYHPIAGGGAIKWFYQTSGLIYQFGGKLYTEDGLSTDIQSVESMQGIKYLIKLFQTYSLPEQVVSFYNSFRFGDLPIGVGSFNDYITLKTAAPELVGQWQIAPSPGIMDINGEVQRWYIANGTGGMIMKSSQNVNNSWKFMKWWMSTSTQTTFSYNLQSAYGPTYVWLSANTHAVENSNLDAYDKRIILDQVKWLRDVPRTPGQYMLERGLSEIWNSSVFRGIPAQNAVDLQVRVIERELRRKMVQFNYIDSKGNVLKPYIVHDIDWIQEQLNKAGGNS